MNPTTTSTPNAPRPTSARSATPPAGFSLVELMVVIVVITILGGVLVPNFTGDRAEAKLRNAGRAFLNTMKLASSLAATHGRVHRIQVDTKDARCWIEVLDDEGAYKAVADSEQELGDGLEVQLRTPEPAAMPSEAEPPPPPLDPREARRFGITVNEDLDRIYFHPDGTADAREVMIRAQDGESVLLRLDPTTARVTYQRLDAGGMPIQRGGRAQPDTAEDDDEPDDAPIDEGDEEVQP